MNLSYEIKQQLQKEFLIYLDNEKNILRDLKLAIQEYEKAVTDLRKEKKFSIPFRFELKLNLSSVREFSDKLYKVFIKEPVVAIDISKKGIFFAISILTPTFQSGEFEMQIIPRLINTFTTKDMPILFRQPSYGLICIEGILIAKCTEAKFLRSSFFTYEEKLLLEFEWKMFSLYFEKFYLNNGNLIKKNLFCTELGEEVICQILPTTAFKTFGRFQALTIRIKNELCTESDLELGEEYLLTGRLCDNFFEALNIQQKNSTLCNILPAFNINFPDTIRKLQFEINQVRPNCPWSFVTALSSFLGSHIIPESSFLNLKMGLLLSLATLQNVETPVPILAVGSDSTNTQILFEAAGKAADKYLKPFISHSYLGGVSKKGVQTNIIWEEGGQFILGAKGVCNLGDWSKYKKEQFNFICQTIESGEIAFNRSEFGHTNLKHSVPLKCAIWTHWCHFSFTARDQLKLKTLINVFGIPFLAEERNETQLQKVFWKNTISAINQSSETLSYSVFTKDLNKFLKIIKAEEITLTESASQLIRNYFVISRRERPLCLPVGAIKTITLLAEAHCRLALRNEILYDDVALIIYLYEETISVFFGDSMNSFPRIPYVEEVSPFVWMAEQMETFREWLKNYTSIEQNFPL